jgi:hypothetical protein
VLEAEALLPVLDLVRTQCCSSAGPSAGQSAFPVLIPSADSDTPSAGPVLDPVLAQVPQPQWRTKLLSSAAPSSGQHLPEPSPMQLAARSS